MSAPQALLIFSWPDIADSFVEYHDFFRFSFSDWAKTVGPTISPPKPKNVAIANFFI
jgi:hypothetical protein